MTALDQIKSIQTILGVTPDGIFGPASQAALNALVAATLNTGYPQPDANGVYHGNGSDFADQSDYDAYNDAIAAGKTIAEALEVGDNCIGVYGQPTGPNSTNPPAYVALPASVLIAEFGSVAAAKFKKVKVTNPANGWYCIAQVGDIGPGSGEIAKGTIIDCNSTTIAGLGLVHPVLAPMEWCWA